MTLRRVCQSREINTSFGWNHRSGVVFVLLFFKMIFFFFIQAYGCTFLYLFKRLLHEKLHSYGSWFSTIKNYIESILTYGQLRVVVESLVYPILRQNWNS